MRTGQGWERGMPIMDNKIGCATCQNYGSRRCYDYCWDGVVYQKWSPKKEENQTPIYALDGYQRDAMRTAGTKGDTRNRLANFALGIAGEAGEVADYVKKVIFHGHILDRENLCKELGDTLWYVAVLANEAGLTLEEVAKVNIAKLRKRYPDGFDQQSSINRVEYK